MRQPLTAPPVLNRTWALDFMTETLSDRRRIRLLTVIDEGNREGLEIAMGVSFPSRRVTRGPERARGAPRPVRRPYAPRAMNKLSRLSRLSAPLGRPIEGQIRAQARWSRPIVRHPDSYPRSGGCQAEVRRAGLRREELRTTVGMASSPVGAGASGFYAAIDSSLHTWSASNAVRFLTTANASCSSLVMQAPIACIGGKGRVTRCVRRS